MKTIHVRGLLKTSEIIQQQLWHAAVMRSTPDAIAPIAQRIAHTEQQVRDLCSQQALDPAQLPMQSQQVYVWLRLLCQPELFQRHLDTLRQLVQCIAQSEAAQRRRAEGKHWQVELANSGYWYRMRPAPKQPLHLDVLINECFIGAPTIVLDAIVHMAFGNNKVLLPIVKNYANGPEYQQISAAMRLSPAPVAAALNGAHYDLQQVFARVNQRFFAGSLAQPHLRWSRGATRRIMGTYQARTDTVMISQSLDDVGVPEFVIDYVMYHELLHKQLGSRFSQGRRHVHFDDFRAADQQYPRFAEVEAFLMNWIGRGA